jgi:hypothetical protein
LFYGSYLAWAQQPDNGIVPQWTGERRRAINAIPNMDRNQRVRENTRVWAGVYFFVALAAALAMALLTPPLQVPDEHQHFYHISVVGR